MILRFLLPIFSPIGWTIVGLLLFSFLSPFVALADSVAHFRFYLLMPLTVFTLLRLSARRWKSVGIAVAVYAATVASLYPALPFIGQGPLVDSGKTLKLMQFNIGFNNRQFDEVITFVSSEQPDVITFQEITRAAWPMLESLKQNYPTQLSCRTNEVGNVVILSKWPSTLNDEAAQCTENNRFGWLQLNVDGKLISVAALHLYWPFPYYQPEQVEALLPLIKEVPKPVVMGGDFNASPWSVHVSKIATAADVELIAGLRWSLRTILRPWLPSLVLPIDHVMMAKGMRGRAVLGPNIGSDHFPVIATISY
ncbi:MAG: endonuclease/exonuclease/phosphatase family protein [Hyphomicrobiales bacterium]